MSYLRRLVARAVPRAEPARIAARPVSPAVVDDPFASEPELVAPVAPAPAPVAATPAMPAVAPVVAPVAALGRADAFMHALGAPVPRAMPPAVAAAPIAAAAIAPAPPARAVIADAPRAVHARGGAFPPPAVIVERTTVLAPAPPRAAPAIQPLAPVPAAPPPAASPRAPLAPPTTIARPAATPRSAPVPAPALAAPTPAVHGVSRAQSERHVSIGRISVEVVPPPAAPAPSPTRVIVRPPAAREPIAITSRLRFGLGQR